MRKFTAILLFFLIAGATAFGGGYQVGLHSARNIGMGLIGTSLTYDASTYFYNPAGGAFLKDKWSFSAGVSLLMARTTYQSPDMEYQYNIEHKINTPFYIYAAFKPYEDLSIGIAVNTPYGNKLSWGDDWVGKYLIQDLAFKAITVQPSFSYKIKDIVSFGAGLSLVFGSVELNKGIPLDGANGTGQFSLEGNAYNVGANLGIMVHPIKGLSLGLDWRSRVNMEVDEGKGTFTVPASLETSFPDQTVKTMLPLPANLDFGASYEFNEKLMIGLNLCYVFWSQYDSLSFEFSNQTSTLQNTSAPANYENKLIFRLGAQYKINDIITARLGGYYDPSPVPDDYLNPQTPSTNQVGLTAGLSVFPVKNLSIDAAFLYLMGLEREGVYTPENFHGKYKSAFYIPAFGLTYNF